MAVHTLAKNLPSCDRRRSWHTRAAIACTTLLACISSTIAQDGSSAVPSNTTDSIVDRVTLEPLDQRVSDLNPLGTSLRITEAGLVVPNDFGQVFRLPGERAMQMRAQGALYAVFPHSTYGTWEVKKTKERFHLPVVGQGTVFYIGAEALRQAYGMPESNASVEPVANAAPDSMHIGSPLATRMINAMPADRAGNDTTDGHATAGAHTDARAAATSTVTAEERANRRYGNASPASTSSQTDNTTSQDNAGTTLRDARDTTTSRLQIAREAESLPPIAADADYRRTRIAELLRKAAAESGAESNTNSNSTTK